MNRLTIKNQNFDVPKLMMGCMRITECSEKELDLLINTALENNINMFDHADIYGNGECEKLFKSATGMSSSFRDKIILQSKSGIRNGYYDFSKDYILKSVDGILQRLGTDYLDIFLLHRPDELMEVEETAEALIKLHESKKVKHFGVSNFPPAKIDLLQKHLPFKLIFNQIQMSMEHCPDISNNLCYNVFGKETSCNTESVIDYSQLNDMTIQTWSPFQKGFFEGVFVGDYKNFKELNTFLDSLAEKYSVTPSAICVAWLLRHPCNMQVILGTTKSSRFAECCKALNINITREEWYKLYKAAGHMLP